LRSGLRWKEYIPIRATDTFDWILLVIGVGVILIAPIVGLCIQNYVMRRKSSKDISGALAKAQQDFRRRLAFMMVGCVVLAIFILWTKLVGSALFCSLLILSAVISLVRRFLAAASQVAD
jgi:hypothetical protein